MRRKDSPYFSLMLLAVLSFLLVAILVFLHPVYRDQPSMRGMPSMAMMMLLGMTRMWDLRLEPMLEVCHELCEAMMGGHHMMPQHGNVILDTANVLLSMLLIGSTALLLGVSGMLVLLWIPRRKSKGKGRK